MDDAIQPVRYEHAPNFRIMIERRSVYQHMVGLIHCFSDHLHVAVKIRQLGSVQFVFHQPKDVFEGNLNFFLLDLSILLLQLTYTVK